MPDPSETQELEALRAEVARLRRLVELNPQVPWEADAEGRITDFSQRWLDLTGLTREEGLGEGWAQVPHPDDLPAMAQAWTRSVETGEPYDIEHRIRLADGSYRWMRSRAHPHREEGRIVAWYGSTEDVHDRKLAEDERRDAAARLWAIQQSLSLAMKGGRMGWWARDIATDAVSWSPELEAIFGLAPGEFAGTRRGFHEMVHPDDAPAFRAAVDRAVGARSDYVAEFRFRRADGSEGLMEGRGRAVYDAEGRPTAAFGVGIDVTEVRRDQAALRESEERYRATFENAAVGIAHTALDGPILRFNDATCRILGRSREELSRLGVDDVSHPDDLDDDWTQAHRLIAGEIPHYRMEKRFVRGDGEVATVDLNVSVARDAAGEALYFVCALVDLTERKRAEEALRVSEARFQAAIGAIGVLWTNSAEGRMEGDQPGWAALTGQSRAEYEGYGWAAAVHPDDAQPTVDAWNEAVRERRPFLFEHRVRRQDGEWRRFAIRAVPVLDGRGEVREWVGVHADVTELRESESQYRQIAEGIPQIVWTTRADGYHDFFNERWYEHTGMERGGERGWEWKDYLHPEDYPSTLEAWTHSLQTGEPYEVEYRFRRANDGAYRWFLGQALAIRDESGAVVRWFGTLTDIHEGKESQRTLGLVSEVASRLAEDLDLERIVQVLTDASTEAVGAQFGSFFYNVTDEQGGSYLLYTLSGATREAFDFGMPRATPLFAPTFGGEGVVRSDDITGDPRYGRMGDPHHGMPKGHLPVVSYLAVPVTARTGEVIGGLFFGHSEPGRFTPAHEGLVASFAAQASVAMDNARLYARVEAMRAELEGKVRARTADLQASNDALTAFTYHVSHDLRGPLRAIVSTSRFVQEDHGDALPPAAHELLNRQAEAANKLGRLIDDLLRLARLSHAELHRTALDVSALAREVSEEALGSHPATAVRVEVADGLRASADPNLLRLALGNLIENAVKYSPQGGTVRVGRREDGAFSVSDEGIGIDPRYFGKVFEPFQRLHRDDEFAGTGIGLSNVRQIVERHGGRVWVESAPGRGSTFLFTLG